MRSTFRLASLLFAALGVAACSSSSNHASLTRVDAKSLCDLVTQCGASTSLDDCEASIGALLVSDSCQSGLDKATCSDLDDNAALEETCFPKCTSPGTTHCNGSYATQCNDSGRTYNVDCAAACTASSMTYTGTCGSSYQGLTSDKDQCWCK